jgi:hypothetical protein
VFRNFHGVHTSVRLKEGKKQLINFHSTVYSYLTTNHLYKIFIYAHSSSGNKIESYTRTIKRITQLICFRSWFLLYNSRIVFEDATILFFVLSIGFRLNATVFLAKVVSERIDCVMECATEPCCRSINYKKTLTLQDESNCEMLHHVIFNTSEKLLEKDDSADYIYLVNPQKVRVHFTMMVRTYNYGQHNFLRGRWPRR